MSLRSILSLALAISTAAVSPAFSQSTNDPQSHLLEQTGPTGLLIFYRVPPANRTGFRRMMTTSGITQLHRLQSQGAFAASHLYFSRYAESDSWDMVLFLSFNTYADVSRWNRVEVETPGGLPAPALALTSAVSTYPVDVVESRSSDTPSENDHHVTVVVPYLVVVPIPDYVKYAAGYVQPQMDGWMQTDIRSRYQLAVGRGAAGKPYSAVLLLEYKDDESFGGRDAVLAETRKRLMSNPAWKAYADNKQTIRTEKPLIITDEIR